MPRVSRQPWGAVTRIAQANRASVREVSFIGSKGELGMPGVCVCVCVWV